MFHKGDARKVGELRVECKTTGSKAYNLKLEEIIKIQSEAISGGDEYWAMQIEFQGQYTNRKVAVIDWSEYMHLIELRKEKEAEGQ